MSAGLFEEEPRICEPGGEGLFLAAEHRLPRGVKILLYFFALCWHFMGVAIISDIFMGAIDVITAKKAYVKDRATGKMRTVKVWNDTIANLTLMSLGSSAPEILLSVIEMFGKNFHSGELGPGTIVGSASFNLLCITAVCVGAIPSPQVRYIKDLNVYAVTATFSILAYVWMLIVLGFSSKDVIELWEAVLTLFLFPILVCTAYLADVGIIGNMPAMANRRLISATEWTKDEIAEFLAKLRRGGDADLAVVAKVFRSARSSPSSHMLYRKQALSWSSKSLGRSRSIIEAQSAARSAYACIGQNTQTGTLEFDRVIRVSQTNGPGWPGSKTHLEFQTAEISELLGNSPKVQGEEDLWRINEEYEACVVFIEKPSYSIEYDLQWIVVDVVREGDVSEPIIVKYRLVPGTAKPGVNYTDMSGTLHFSPNQKSRSISIRILEVEEFMESKDFHVEIFDPEHEGDHGDRGGDYSPRAEVILGITCKCHVDIVRESAGRLSFEETFVRSTVGTENYTLNLKVIRSNGYVGSASVFYRTIEDNAIPGVDFEPVEGQLEFCHGQVEGDIPVLIKAGAKYSGSVRFKLALWDVSGCCFEDDKSELYCFVEILVDSRQTQAVDAFANLLGGGKGTLTVRQQWTQQFVNALSVMPDDDDDEEDEGEERDPSEPAKPGILDWVYHILTVFWKLLFSLAPPPNLWGGWPCFCSALGFIGLVTAMVGDLAELLGCEIGIPDAVTAITFVALGTSLPDTFASMLAAQHDEHADASIGNVVGSNSVNVFLGLGTSWTVGSMYWTFKGQDEAWQKRYPAIAARFDYGVLAVEADGLSFSVFAFTCSALGCISVMAIRRALFGGELGGPFMPKVVTIVYLLSLWLGYIAISWLYLIVKESE
eukprot:TRINITY_DN3062_c1_g1_i1.p1 TRINITY_DN3062_c1_g1~~TRINITY_DN3062_c1_g1_i1.p1  ORF type:complete len:883 (+),score=200.83 TRINITY_DN3062_c1_g1_i1:128-2776(+)